MDGGVKYSACCSVNYKILYPLQIIVVPHANIILFLNSTLLDTALLLYILLNNYSCNSDGDYIKL